MKLKKERGITLIALIVTIIVLIILAGVSINLVFGQQGIITRAKEAVEEQKIGTAREKLVLAIAEYEVQMRKETMYSILNKVEGLESIEPDDEQAGLPYTVIVDGYEFLITEELEIIYQGKASAELPEIISVEKSVVSDEQVKITLQAKIDEKEGLDKVILIKDKVEIETRAVTGKEVTEEFIVTGNGTYTVKVVGKNKRQKISEEIQVTEIAKLSGTLQAGTVVDGEVLLTITGQTQEGTIKEIQIYEVNNNSETSITQIACEDNTQTVEKEYTIYIPFSEENNYLAKIIDNNNNSIDTNTVSAENSNSIKTAEDLQTLATLVNSGNTFEGKTLKQVANIDLSSVCSSTKGSWNPIGYNTTDDAYWFDGTYNGNEKEISGLYINSAEDKTVGLFGLLGYDGVIKNLTTNGEVKHTTTSKVAGGIVGRNEGTIENCINYVNVYNASNSGGGISGNNYNIIKNSINNGNVSGEYSIGGITGSVACSETLVSNNEIISNNVTIEGCQNNGNINTSSSTSNVGGVVGENIGGSIISCKNNANAQVKGVANVGGICGNQWREGTMPTINLSVNEGTVIATSNIVGGIVGNSEGDIKSCKNKGKVTSEGNPTDQANTQGTGGIAGRMATGTIQWAANTGNIVATTGYFVGGIAGYSDDGATITQCYNYNASISGKINAVGGIVGRGDNICITKCYNYFSSNNNYIIAENENAGGIAGVINYSSVIQSCYNIGKNINAKNNVGNIVGLVTSIENMKVEVCFYLDTSTLEGIGKEDTELTEKDITAKSVTYFKYALSNTSSVAYLLNGSKTAGAWTQSSSKNGGYPYLVDNVPEE